MATQIAAIEGWARTFLGGEPRFGTLATVSRGGFAHQAVVWFLLRGDTIVVNSRVGRIWPGNLLREPRCSLLVGEGYEWVSVRGTVEPVFEQLTAQADIAEMARRYRRDDPAKAERMIAHVFVLQQRISFVLLPERVVEHRDD
jgi:Pyridoxamine 5'-phosphate oxidase